jgi:SNF2 family DNA or RNA helicase
VAAGEVTAVNDAVKANKLIQICAGALYGEDREILEVDAKPRLDVVLEVIEEAGTKVIVFVPFVSSIELVSSYLRKHGLTVECVHGEVSKHERDRIFQAFQRTATPRVLVAIPGAMSHGLTLTAASTVVWYAPITSNDTFVQANGRITRPGQTQKQLIVMIEGSDIERKYYSRLRLKQKVQGTLLDAIKESREMA